MYDYIKFLKRGFGRGKDYSSVYVRSGLLTNNQGVELAKHHDTERPAALDDCLDYTGLTEDEHRLD